MKCIVGLGNPGFKYRKTRHNIGFMIIDHIASTQGWKLKKSGYESLYTVEKWKNEQVILVKPQTFMNLSGRAVKAIVDDYKLDLNDILVIYDDLDLPTGKIRLRQTGGHGGHNGMRHIIEQLGSKDFNRIRFGIGRPETNMSVIDYVLGKFNKSDQEVVKDAIEQSNQAVEDWMEKPFLEVMNSFNASK